MRGLTVGERHRWHGQPGAWTCTRCQYRMTGGGLDDGICPASMPGALDFAAAKAAPGPTRLDTAERVAKVPRQRGLGESFSVERERVDKERITEGGSGLGADDD